MIKRLKVISFLPTSERQIRMAKSNVHQVIVVMRPQDFLQLTTNGKAHYNQILKDAQPIENYRQYVRSGENDIRPFLEIDLKNRKVTGHEGRHRAASLINSKFNKMKVSLKLVGGTKSKYDYTWDDVPPIIQSQYTDAKLSKALMKPVVRSWRN